MEPRPTSRLRHVDAAEPKPCWKELLQNALDGIYPNDPRLEDMLDRFERMP